MFFLGDNGLLSKKGIKAFLTELTRISDFLGESNSFGSQYVDSTVAQCLHVANQKLLNEDTFFKWFFKEPQIIVWLPTLKNHLKYVSLFSGFWLATCKH